MEPAAIRHKSGSPINQALEVVVFSYNRGRLLWNCVESIRQLMPGTFVTVFDDNSDDDETRTVLERLHQRGWADIKTPQDNTNVENRFAMGYGGLYRNIQTYLDSYARRPYALFLDDDMQVVRDVTPRDYQTLDCIFSDYPRAAFVYPGFLYHSLCEYVDPASVTESDPTFSFRHSYEFSGFFGVCIAHVYRLRAAEWTYENELRSSLKARDRFGTMRLMRYPFVAHLPSPPTYRRRNRTLSQRVWERSRVGLYPIDTLTENDVDRLFSLRTAFPTAEAFLTSKSFWGSHPWPYTKLDGAPWPIRALDRLESTLRWGIRNKIRTIWNQKFP